MSHLDDLVTAGKAIDAPNSRPLETADLRLRLFLLTYSLHQTIPAGILYRSFYPGPVKGKKLGHTGQIRPRTNLAIFPRTPTLPTPNVITLVCNGPRESPESTAVV